MKKCKTANFIEKSKKVHGDTYDYSITEYIHVMDKVKIICKEHGLFYITPNHHLNGKGCRSCGRLRIYKFNQSNIDEFINKATNVHNNIYDYKLTNYIKSDIKVKIICKIHGTFECTPNNHLRGKGCPICRLSKGEIRVKKFLDDNKLNYISQHRFKDCKNKRPLPFDFYLPEYNICIEYDGKQHYLVDCWSSNSDKNIKRFNNTQINDKIKDEYCINNNIHLIRIPYIKLDEIENILKRFNKLTHPTKKSTGSS